MQLFRSKILRRVLLIASEHSSDLDGADLSSNVNESGKDELTGRIWISVDRLRNRTLNESISDILASGGFSANLENTLSTIDTLKFGVIAETNDSPDTPDCSIKIQNYFDVVSFELPTKSRAAGELLQLFYEETSAYEAEITKLSMNTSGKGSDRQGTVGKLKARIATLEAINSELTASQQQLLTQLDDALQNHASATRVIENQNLLPENLDLGVIKEVLIEENLVRASISGASQSFSLGLFNVIPSKGSSFLIYNSRNEIDQTCFVVSGSVGKFEQVAGEVLSARDDAIKIRDINRQMWSAKLLRKKESISYQRGDWVIIKEAAGIPCAVNKCPKGRAGDLLLNVQAAICTHQLSQVENYFPEQQRSETAENEVA
jgi:hypothetical protein